MPNVRLPSQPARFRYAALVLCLASPAVQALPPAVIANTDITITLVPGTKAPRLEELRGSGITLRNRAEEPLPSTVLQNGIPIPLTWHFNSALSRTGPHTIVYVYESKTPHLRASWQWQTRSPHGPTEHQITIQNLGTDEVWLPLLDSLCLDLAYPLTTKLRHFSVEKGADTPSAQGTHLAQIDDGYHWTGKSSTYARPEPGEAREIIPAEFVFTADLPQSGWYTGIEFSGRTRIALERTGTSVHTVLGLNPDPGPFRTRIPPGESFQTPTVFLGTFTGGPDGAANQLRPWVRTVLGNPRTWSDPQYPLTVNNSWGSGMQVDEALALRMIADSKELGLEMFHLDAGWFRGVGDLVSRSRKVSPRPRPSRRCSA